MLMQVVYKITTGFQKVIVGLKTSQSECFHGTQPRNNLICISNFSIY
jgi:hypothetical protein